MRPVDCTSAWWDEQKRRSHFWIQGRLFAYHETSKHEPHVHAIKRGAICTFSRQSRIRMLRFVQTVDWTAIPNSLFVTLTYPKLEYEPNSVDRRVHRYLFTRLLEEYVNRPISLLWRVEWLPRKSGKEKGLVRAHVHMLILGVRFIDKWIIRSMWKRALSFKNHVHTDVRKATGPEGAAHYVAKYCSKQSADVLLLFTHNSTMTGRHWGIQRKPLIPMSDVHMLSDPTYEQVVTLLQYYNDCATWQGGNWVGSFQLFGKFADGAKSLLQKMLLTTEDVGI